MSPSASEKARSAKIVARLEKKPEGPPNDELQLCRSFQLFIRLLLTSAVGVVKTPKKPKTSPTKWDTGAVKGRDRSRNSRLPWKPRPPTPSAWKRGFSAWCRLALSARRSTRTFCRVVHTERILYLLSVVFFRKKTTYQSQNEPKYLHLNLIDLFSIDDAVEWTKTDSDAARCLSYVEFSFSTASTTASSAPPRPRISIIEDNVDLVVIIRIKPNRFLEDSDFPLAVLSGCFSFKIRVEILKNEKGSRKAFGILYSATFLGIFHSILVKAWIYTNNAHISGFQ